MKQSFINLRILERRIERLEEIAGVLPETEETDEVILVSPSALSVFASNRTMEECVEFINKNIK